MPASGNVGLAFGLVAAAGAATSIGAALVFFVNIAKPRILAASLGFAAGVMLYVSFAEIFLRKSLDGFITADYSDVEAYRYSTLGFFAGFVIIFLLDKAVHLIVNWVANKQQQKAGGLFGSQSQAVLLDEQEPPYAAHRRRRARKNTNTAAAVHTPSCPPDIEAACCSAMNKAAANVAAAYMTAETASPHDATGHEASGSRLPVVPGVAPPNAAHAAASAAAAKRKDSFSLIANGDDCDNASDRSTMSMTTPVDDEDLENKSIDPTDANVGVVLPTAAGTSSSAAAALSDASRTREQPTVMEVLQQDPHHAALHKMGLLTALAIFIHNLPEGLATFVAALSDTGVGIGIAVAIAVHNIPEGICVALPIYYATGSRKKAFMWAMLSGMSEPVGAFIGWLALYGDTSLAFAIVFALVAGMMVYISIKELLPMALRYDPKDTVATTSVIVGMVTMAASLLLFTL